MLILKASRDKRVSRYGLFDFLEFYLNMIQKLDDRQAQRAKNHLVQGGKYFIHPFAKVGVWQLSITPIGQFLNCVRYFSRSKIGLRNPKSNKFTC